MGHTDSSDWVGGVFLMGGSGIHSDIIDSSSYGCGQADSRTTGNTR